MRLYVFLPGLHSTHRPLHLAHFRLQEARTAKASFIAQLLEEYETEKNKDKDLEDDIAALGGILFLGKH